MAENGNGKVVYNVLATVAWGIAAGFAALCISGFWYLNDRSLVNAATISLNGQRISKLEECMMNTKENLADMKYMLRNIEEKIIKHTDLK